MAPPKPPRHRNNRPPYFPTPYFPNPQSPISNPQSPISNPFGDTGRITNPTRFFNREELLRQIFEELTKGVNLSLLGESQVGKSSLLSMICAWGPERLDRPQGAFAYLSLQWVSDEDEFYAALCDALNVHACRGYQLHRALRERRCVLCLDEIEKMAWDGFSKDLRSQLRGLGYGLTYGIALEGALKLKEITYAHCEGMLSTEFKHGSLSAVHDGYPVLFVGVADDAPLLVSAINEVTCRGGRAIMVAPENERLRRNAHDYIVLPPCDPLLACLLAVLPLQLLSYKLSVARGIDPDFPRNLSKTLTVD